MKRRDFMRVSAGGAALAATSSLWSRTAQALPYGVFPTQYEKHMLPKARQAESILEVFMYGGVSPWETFYCNEDMGRGQERFIHTFYDKVLEACGLCGYDQEDGFQFATPYATDANGRQVFLGPYLRPLLRRPDVLNRMRVVINRHSLEPHEAAIPYAISGKTLGSPSLASLGAHIQRHFVETDSSGRTAPFAYGFATAGGFIPNDNVLSLVATGLHPGSSRPLLVKVDNVARLNGLLDRTGVGSLEGRERYDALMQAYFAQYESQLTFGGSSEQVRAAKFKELLTAMRSVQDSQAVQDVLDPALFQPIVDESCTRVPRNGGMNVPAMSLNLATHLLTHPVSPARHCCVVDVGIREADGGGGYDTHSEMPLTQAQNLHNMLKNLLANINEPGENNPNKIDLDKTMVILNQEFGRAPVRQNPTTNGRNHWPYGYMQVYIGGPITEQQKGLYGGIEDSGHANVFTTPTENRIAAMLAMGIWPFDQAGFSPSDVQNQAEDAGAIIDVTKRVLGYDV